MADFFVDGSHGDDSDNGSSWALAKASIGGAIAAASNDDTITVAPGVYAEALTVSKNLTIQAAQRLTARITQTAATTVNITATGTVVLSGLYIVMGTTRYITAVYDTAGQLTLTDCMLSCVTPGRYTIMLNATNASVTNCCFYRGAGGAGYGGRILISFGAGTCSVVGCTLYGACDTYGAIRLTTGDYSIIDNIVQSLSNQPYVRTFGAPNTLLLDYNRYVDAISADKELNISGTLYTSLAAAQAAGYENHGSEGDPEFADTTRKAFFIPKDSALLTAGSSGGRVGAWTGAQTFSAGANAWSAWTGTNCTYVGDQWTLDDGQASGTVLSPVIDLGAAYDVTGLGFDGTQTFPTNIVDTSNAGASPEYQTVEIRGQAASFASGDGTPAWQEVDLNAEASPALGGWRYVQARVTLRSDGS